MVSLNMIVFFVILFGTYIIIDRINHPRPAESQMLKFALTIFYIIILVAGFDLGVIHGQKQILTRKVQYELVMHSDSTVTWERVVPVRDDK